MGTAFAFFAIFAFFVVNSFGQGLTLRDTAFVAALSGSHPAPGGGGGGGSEPSAPSYYWSFEETGSSVDRLDQVASKILRPNASGEKSASGLQGLAVHWGACDDYNFVTPDPNGIGYTSGNDLSVAYWMKKTATDAEDMTRFKFNTDGSHHLNVIQSGPTDLDVYFNGTSHEINPSYTHDTSWHLFSIVYDGGTDILEFFIDGVSKGSSSTPYALAGYTDVEITLDGRCGDEMLIDELAIWMNHKLDADEMTWLINSGAGRQWSDF